MKQEQSIKLINEIYSPLFKFFDFLVINVTLTFVINFMFRNESAIDLFSGFLFSILFIVIGQFLHIYKRKKKNIFYFFRLLLTFLFSILCLQGLNSSINSLEGIKVNHLYDHVIWVWFSISFLLLVIGRVIGTFFYKKYASHVQLKVAIVGLTVSGIGIEKELLELENLRDIKLSFYDDRSPARCGYLFRSDYSGKISELLALAKNNGVDRVYIALPMVANHRISEILRAFSDTTVETFIVPDLYAYRLSLPSVKKVGSMFAFSAFGSPFDGVEAFIKRAEDLIIGSAILLMILPIMAVIAAIIKITSKGPVFFKQDRYGLGGVPIKVWKFRSMKVMENTEVVTQATKGDPRVTPFGAFLRRTSLDELPQFINVLQGSMSIVGPRPHAVAHNEQYRKIVDNYMIRQKVKPGITGLAQIKGYRGETDTLDKMEKRVYFDIQYMQKWSLKLDLKIIIMTIFKGFVGESAY
jgi:putative colanic acid biosynthesis UDP-glucose lipid carrier transferase